MSNTMFLNLRLYFRCKTVMSNVNRGKASHSKIQTNLFGLAMREMRGQRPVRGPRLTAPLRGRD